MRLPPSFPPSVTADAEKTGLSYVSDTVEALTPWPNIVQWAAF
jgi:hypothetical protein